MNRNDESGQALVLAAFSMIAMMALASFTVDVGYVMNTKRRLQASADAAAIAGAQMLPASTAVSTANAYSSLSGQKNSYTKLTGVTMASGYPQIRCLSSTGLPCAAPSNGNAIVVRQQVTLPLFFARVIGMTSMNITATATASMRGGNPRPLDLMIVLDTTGSMWSNSCTASVTGVISPKRLDCALAGIRVLLGTLWPCPSRLATCGTVTNGNVAQPLDAVGLMIFPGLKSAIPVSREYDCTNNVSISPNVDIAAYNASPKYAIVPLSTDYRVSDTATSLNGAVSNLVKAVAWDQGVNCPSSSYGVEAPGGVGTYYAAALSAAQAALVASTRTNVQRAIIILSDGDAFNSTGGPANPCRTALTAATAAKSATPATWIYSIAYGAGSYGCDDDSPAITSLQTMQQMATDSSRFFNQPSAGDLTAIFQRIADDLTTARLLPDDVT